MAEDLAGWAVGFWQLACCCCCPCPCRQCVSVHKVYSVYVRGRRLLTSISKGPVHCLRMPPKKKKQPRNAFFFFMMDWKKEKEEQGQRFKNLLEVTALCSEDWKHLPEHNVRIYKQMEKEAKGQDKDDKANKFNSLGVPYTQIDNAKREQELANQKMYSDIDNMLAALATKDCDGSCDIPLGYRYEVKQNTDSVHNIPDPRDFDLVERDWDKIRREVFNFLEVRGTTGFPLIFTMSGDDANTNCYEMASRSFLEDVSIYSDESFRLYDLSLFFFKFYEVCQDMAVKMFDDQEEAFIVQGVAHQQLNRDIYNFAEGITCEFHANTDLYHNCSKSFVQRWVFLICEFCCKAMQIKLVPGKHCISSAKVSLSYMDNDSRKRSQLTASAVSSDLKNLTLGTSPQNPPAGAWGGRMHTEAKTQPIDKEVLFIDRSKVPDPTQIRVLQTGQSANVVSEFMPEPSNVRLPTTRGRGETLARALSLHNAAANPSLSSDDFPALGSSRPGRLEKPLSTGWGRGFLKQQ
ncbi:Maelstrom [Frankliniella occidentalis]|nr:Maelstrom [Frankliniella occidentalis]